MSSLALRSGVAASLAILGAAVCQAGPAWSPSSCPKDLKPIAEELVKLELAGGSLSEATPCIDQSKFKLIFARNEGSGEKENTPDAVLEDGDSFGIDEIVPKSDLGEYIVNFSVHQKSGKVFKDSLVFVAHTTPRKQKVSGCASLLMPPQRVYVWSRCLKK